MEIIVYIYRALNTCQAYFNAFLSTARRAGLGAGSATAHLQGKGRDQSTAEPGPAHEIGRGTGQDFREAVGHRGAHSARDAELLGQRGDDGSSEISEHTCAGRSLGIPHRAALRLEGATLAVRRGLGRLTSRARLGSTTMLTRWSQGARSGLLCREIFRKRR